MIDWKITNSLGNFLNIDESNLRWWILVDMILNWTLKMCSCIENDSQYDLRIFHVKTKILYATLHFPSFVLTYMYECTYLRNKWFAIRRVRREVQIGYCILIPFLHVRQSFIFCRDVFFFLAVFTKWILLLTKYFKMRYSKWDTFV